MDLIVGIVILINLVTIGNMLYRYTQEQRSQNRRISKLLTEIRDSLTGKS